MTAEPFKKITVILMVFFLQFYFQNALFADTIILKNKSRVNGVIESENKDMVEINLGFGTTTFQRSEIDEVLRSDAKETEAIWQKWGAQQKIIEARKPEEEKKWKERQLEAEKLRLENQNLKKERDEYGPKMISAKAKDGQMLMNVLLNDKVRVSLILDSGAGAMVLTRRVADQLGIDADKLAKNRIQVADGRWVDMGFTKIPNVKVQNIEFTGSENNKKPGVEAKEVDTCIILEGSTGKDKFSDGLLGMAYLQNFKFKADYKNATVTFERLKDENKHEVQ